MKKLLIVIGSLLFLAVASATSSSATGFYWQDEGGTEMISISATFVNNTGEPQAAQIVSVPVTTEPGTPLYLEVNIPALEDGSSCSCAVSAPTENILWGENGEGVLYANILWGE